ncbi:MAG: bile acid:sodium symporter family protein [Bacteroidales bacterium]|jgi:BASS family bile acid:Na+ symporter|nr:bile acid:sodium symporter family protein [Bacteroidales bacterium]
MNAIFIVLPILTVLMFQLGLELRLNDFRQLIKRPKPLIAGLTGQMLLLPALGFLWAWVFQLDELFFIGLILITCSPGGSSSNIFSLLAKGDVALSVGLTTISSILTLFTIPFIMSFTVGLFGGGDGTINLPVGALIIQNVLLMLVPILLGQLFKFRYPEQAGKLKRILGKIAFPALILLVSIFFIQHYATIFRYIGKLGLCILLLIITALLGGYLLSMLLKLREKKKRTIVIEVGMQNAAQAIAVASGPFIFNNDVMAIPAIIYALLMNVILLVYIKIKGKKDVIDE